MRGLRFLFARVAVTAVMLAPASCASILGIDPGQPRDDGADGSSASDGSNGSGDVTTGGSDASADSVPDGAQPVDAADTQDARDATSESAGDAPNEANEARDVATDAPLDTGDAATQSEGGDACTSDPNWCTTHCGAGLDNCGATRQCVNNCPAGWLCEATTNTCQCQADPSWCTGRCGTPRNNCGTPVGCGVCPGTTMCIANTCGCVPNPNPCGMMQCGQALDSCNHPVTCGVNGMCANGGVCNASTGTCCSPNPNPCAGRCGVSVDNGCGQMIACPAQCAGAQVCDPQGNCCMTSACGNACGTLPNGCGGKMTCGCGVGAVCDSQGLCCVPNGGCSPTCIDNCGQPAPCCPKDSGAPETGSCDPNGSACGPDGCCSGYCGQGSICVSFCGAAGAPCMTTQQCCQGLTCSTLIAASASSGGGAVPPPMGSCQ
jgi:hypothetical protein